MRRLSTITALALMLTVSATAYADEAGKYVATQGDATLAAMFSRWAAIDGRTVKWDVSLPLRINGDALTDRANLAGATDFADAVSRVLDHWEREPRYPGPTPDFGPDGAHGIHLQGCVYRHGPVALEVHEVHDDDDTQECSSRL